MNIALVLATARKGRLSVRASNFLGNTLSDLGHKYDLIDVRDYKPDATDNSGESKKSIKLRDLIINSDGIIIVSPEYNHTFPGEFKMMIDLLYKEYNKKPVALCGVSIGAFGGVRVIEELRNFLSGLGMFITTKSLLFPNIDQVLDENSNLIDQSYKKRSEDFVNAFEEFIKDLNN